MARLRDHPEAAYLELATDKELEILAQDIAANGQLDTIDLFEGKILDGRNRYRACKLAGVEPRCQEWEANGVSPMRYVISKNIHRRHLTVAQRAALAVALLPRLEEEAKERQREHGGTAPGITSPERGGSDKHAGESKQQAAELVGIGRTSVAAAELIAKKEPETFDKMKRGEISVTAAATEAGVGTGTYTKRKPRPKLTSEEVLASATAADNIDAAHFYTGLASNVLLAFDQIPQERLEELLDKAVIAVAWWREIVVELKKEVRK